MTWINKKKLQKEIEKNHYSSSSANTSSMAAYKSYKSSIEPNQFPKNTLTSLSLIESFLEKNNNPSWKAWRYPFSPSFYDDQIDQAENRTIQCIRWSQLIEGTSFQHYSLSSPKNYQICNQAGTWFGSSL